MSKRIGTVVKKVVIVLVAGMIYAVWLAKTSIGIPCPVRSITGFRCPGCGISHMCISLIHGDIRGAFYSNRMVFFIVPVIAVVIIRQLYRYIRYGSKRLNRGENIVICIAVLMLLLWGIIRNVPAFQYLN